MALFDKLKNKLGIGRTENPAEPDTKEEKAAQQAESAAPAEESSAAAQPEEITQPAGKAPEEAGEAPRKESVFGWLKSRLTRTHDNLSVKMDDLVENAAEVDDDFFEEMTDILIMADVGVHTSDQVVQTLKARCEKTPDVTPAAAREMLREILTDVMGSEPMRLSSPMVLFVIGVNGVGKTTSIGKLAARLKTVGRRVIICAGDTFRAAAADQLTVWAERAGVPIVKQKEGADPAAVVFDGIQAAKQRGADVLIVDTAGRLHNKSHLMEELKKMARVISREFPEAKTRSLLVIDATTGQNGLAQAQVFKDVADLEGIILTKLDGTAKGGIAIAIRSELGLPVRYIGVGEQLDDLHPFDAKEFIDAIL